MQKAIIEIKTIQKNNDTKESDVIELITEGKYYEKNGKSYLLYDETEITGMEGTTTNIKISEDSVIMRRRGNVRSVMEFQTGVRHTASYDTMYGSLNTELLTRAIDIEFKDREKLDLEINIKYDVAVKGMFEGSNIMQIKAKAQ